MRWKRALVPITLLLLVDCAGVVRLSAERPALVVMIAVDQLRGDLLDRYDTLFTAGFRRLRDQGTRFERALVDHAITISHPGHVTLATGLVPARHGIVDAAFFEKKDGKRVLVDALEDPAEKILGAPEQKGVSPRKIMAPTLAEWTTGSDSQARAVCIGAGQYASLLHAGHLRGHVYWYSGDAGRFVTSSYYRESYPDWVERFNREDLTRFQDASEAWECRVPAEARSRANPDDSRFEADHEHVSFPHRLQDVVPKEQLAAEAGRRRALGWWFSTTPVLDEATLALAKEAVKAEALGQRGHTDFLSIVVSAVDDIGHWYGPSSLEQLDNLLRLDKELGDLFAFLDATVGAGRYVVGLTADHGIPEVPEDTIAHGGKARRVPVEELDRILEDAREAAAAAHAEDEVEARVAAAVERHEVVADAMTTKDLSAAGASSDPYLALYRNSWRPDRVPRFPVFSLSGNGEGIGQYGVAVRLVEGAMIDLDPAVHGSPYDYDRRVPLVFMGPGIPPGASREPARTVDAAPTLAALAGIPIPEDLDGRPLLRP